jgi:polyvinyl alcohol dehydrogenase (cytochrome)
MSADLPARAWRVVAGALPTAVAVSVAVILTLPGLASADWPIFGRDLLNTRSASGGGPTPSEVGSMKQAWTFGSSNGDFTGTPVVAGGTLVAGTNLGSIYALDATNGKLRWSRNVGQPINGSAAIDLDAPGGPTAFVPIAQPGDPQLLALSLSNGSVRWKTSLGGQPSSANADLFGSPTYWRGTVYIGTSGPGNDESTARGSVVALDEAGGKVRWQTFTVPRGDDGGGVWSTPAIDTASGRLYVGTGNAYHRPAADTTDSMMVLSAFSGQILGHFQTAVGDVWEANDPTAGPDYDFGASPNLIAGPAGRPLVGEGSKSGTYWALDPATMQPVWHTAVGPGSSADGGIGSSAYDGTRIYGVDSIDSQVFALAPDGSAQWNSFDSGTAHFSPVAIGDGTVYSADSDGFLTARDATTGTILAKLPLGAPTFGGISVVGHAVYVAIGTGPPSPAQPIPGVDTSQQDGPGSIVAFGDASQSGAASPGTAGPAPGSAVQPPHQASRSPARARHRRAGLRLTVRPRQVRVNVPAAFRVVVARAGRPVVGVTVRLAGRRVRTNRLGAAMIRLRLRSPGVYVVRGSRGGLGSARATVYAR